MPAGAGLAAAAARHGLCIRVRTAGRQRARTSKVLRQPRRLVPGPQGKARRRDAARGALAQAGRARQRGDARTERGGAAAACLAVEGCVGEGDGVVAPLE